MKPARRMRILLVATGTCVGIAIALIAWRAHEACIRTCRCESSGPSRVPEYEAQSYFDGAGLRRYRPIGCELDSNGFRNRGEVTKPDVVAMGDSNTWGGPIASESWPRVLASRTGRPVYNLSMPGWGPVDFLAATPMALGLHPRVIAVQVYSGNDIYDSYARVVKHPAGMDAVLTDFVVPHALQEDWIEKAASDEANAAHLNDWDWGDENFDALAKAQPNRLQRLVRGGTHVTISPHYRLFGTNLREPRIALGLTFAKKALTRMAALTKAQGVPMIVTLLPSKELVYCPIFKEAQSVPDWAQICRDEQEMSDEIAAALKEAGVAVTSVLPELREAAARGDEIWPNTDTHPHGEGLAIFADVMRRSLDAPGK